MLKKKHNDDSDALQCRITLGLMKARRGNIGQRAFLTARQRLLTAALKATATAMAQRGNDRKKVLRSVPSHKMLVLQLLHYH